MKAQANGVDAKLERARTILSRLANDAWRAVEVNETLWGANEDAELWRLVRDAPEFRTFSAVRASLREHLTLVIVRMHDTYQPAREAGAGRKAQKEKGGNRASLPHLVHILGDDAVVAQLEAEGRELIAQARTAYEALTKEEPGRSLVEQLRQHRNWYLAHALFDMGDREGRLLFGNINDLLDLTLPVVRDLAFGLGGVQCNFDQVRQVRRGWAGRFWTSFRRGLAAPN